MTRHLPRAIALTMAAALATLGASARADDRPGPEKFFQNERLTGAQISPDGQTIALTMAQGRDDRVRLVAIDLKTMKPTALAGYDDADIHAIHWVNDHRLVFDLDDRQAPAGELDSAWGLYAVNTDGTGLRQLVNQHGTNVVNHGEDVALLPWNTVFLAPIGDQTGNDVYVFKFDEYDVKHVDYRQLQRLDTTRGRVTDVEAPLHSADWVFDRGGQLRVVTTLQDNHRRILARDTASGQWTELADFERFYASGAFTPSYIDETGTLFVESNNGADTTGVWTYDLEHRRMGAEPFLQSKGYDVDPAYVTVRGKLAGLRYDVDAEVTQWLSPELQALQDKVDKMLPTTVNRISVGSRGDGRFALIHATSDRVPGLYFLYKIAEGRLVALGNAQPDVDPKQMARMEQVHYAARDGLQIPAWLTIPHGAERKNLPLVVLVHGGPWVRGQVWGWNPEVQFLAARGYAVLEPEYRGSTGYGSALFSAGWKQWGRAMQDDVADGVKWAVAQGIVDPKRVCIAGASYGGYAVLMGLVNDPAVYRCGIDWVGVTDIDLMYSTRWSDLSDTWKRYGMPRLIGDREADAAQLEATSPIAQVARIHAPLLLAYGGKDLRVPIVHGEAFHDALMKQPGAKAEWVVYDQEGHGWRSVATRLDFWKRAADFLDANIGAPAN